jgi:hypothetical protein
MASRILLQRSGAPVAAARRALSSAAIPANRKPVFIDGARIPFAMSNTIYKVSSHLSLIHLTCSQDRRDLSFASKQTNCWLKVEARVLTALAGS